MGWIAGHRSVACDVGISDLGVSWYRDAVAGLSHSGDPPMIRPLRRIHRVVIFTLIVLLPWLVAASLVARVPW